jgi:hypothetical protein
MTGGQISDNKAKSTSSVALGGGVCFRVPSGTYSFTMTGGQITGNTVESTSSASGGGVYVTGTGSSFTMNGGQIAGNHAIGTPSGYGGGVYVNSTFTMDGGKILGNTASLTGGGVYVYGSFEMSGSALVDTGNVVYLNTGKTIEITGDLIHDPVANIAGVSSGTQLLTGSHLSGNYEKFLVGGLSGLIGSDGKRL